MTLIALVAMTLAAVALVRSTDTGGLVAGNVALKQGASQEAEKGLNLAYACLATGGALLTGSRNSNSATCNYFASLQKDTQKPFGVPDKLDDPALPVIIDNTATTGNKITYVIERMCTPNAGFANTPITWDPQRCVPSPFGVAAKGGDGHQAKPGNLPPSMALYRVSVKAYSARGVASYTQMILSGTI